MPRRGLGRGLDLLIPAEDSASDGLLQVEVDKIVPNPHQPRTLLADSSLGGLADSIREHGVIQPLVVTRLPSGGYQLIAGERRWRASQLAGLETVPVIVKEAAPQEMLELALVENIQRADLNPLEEAAAYQHLVEDFGLSQSEVARRVGKSRPAVNNVMRLLNAAASLWLRSTASIGEPNNSCHWCSRYSRIGVSWSRLPAPRTVDPLFYGRRRRR